MFEISKKDESYKEAIFLEKELMEKAYDTGLQFQRLMSYYRCAMMEIETKFRVLDEEYSLLHDRNPISSIKTRLKKLPSIMEKLQRRDLDISMDSIEKNLTDIAGVRVVCSFVEDVYTLADALLTQDDVKLIERKDYIANPKPNGYRSLHLIIEIPIFLEKEKKFMKVEVQLRTIAMNCWASLEHQLFYKKDCEFSDDMKAELYECAMLSSELDAKMDRLRKNAKI